MCSSDLQEWMGDRLFKVPTETEWGVGLSREKRLKPTGWELRGKERRGRLREHCGECQRGLKGPVCGLRASQGCLKVTQ